ncbi:MAG: cation diffusion facilitator family transporter [Prevotella sp.]
MSARRNKRIYRVTLLGGLVNAILIIVKFAAGVIGHSAAMIADAVHSMSDFATDIIVMVFVRLSNKPADEDHAYGHGKYETVATTIIGLALFVVGLMLGWDGMVKIYHFALDRQLQSPGTIALVAALVSIVSKEWIFRVTRKVAKDVSSQALEANAWHHRSDALSSVGTALGIGGALLLGSEWAVLDAVAAVVVSCLIVITSIRLIRKSSGELLEERLPIEIEKKIKDVVCRTDDVTDIHRLYTRRIGNSIAIEMHMRLPAMMPLVEAHKRANEVERHLREVFGNSTHIMIHIEPTK